MSTLRWCVHSGLPAATWRLGGTRWTAKGVPTQMLCCGMFLCGMLHTECLRRAWNAPLQTAKRDLEHRAGGGESIDAMLLKVTREKTNNMAIKSNIVDRAREVWPSVYGLHRQGGAGERADKGVARGAPKKRRAQAPTFVAARRRRAQAPILAAAPQATSQRAQWAPPPPPRRRQICHLLPLGSGTGDT